MVGHAQRQTGFTLIEVMVTMAIIAILASMAIPAYSEYVKRGMIPEATNALADARVKAEQYLQDSATHDFTGFAYTQGTAHFGLACALGDPGANGKIVGYVCTATGTGMMGSFAYTIDQSGGKTTSNVPSGWSKPSPNNCWAIRSNGKC